MLRPAITVLHQRPSLSVKGVTSSTLDARLLGATTALGRQAPWTPLRLRGGTWRGQLPAPTLRGVYVIELRTGSVHVRSHVWLRVYQPGTLTRPSFGTPEEVVRWWVRTVRRGDVVAIKRWPPPAFDRRDRGLHRLFVVAYSPAGDAAVEHRLGMFVTAVRDRYDGEWRLLESTVSPA